MFTAQWRRALASAQVQAPREVSRTELIHYDITRLHSSGQRNYIWNTPRSPGNVKACAGYACPDPSTWCSSPPVHSECVKEMLEGHEFSVLLPSVPIPGESNDVGDRVSRLAAATS